MKTFLKPTSGRRQQLVLLVFLAFLGLVAVAIAAPEFLTGPVGGSLAGY